MRVFKFIFCNFDVPTCSRYSLCENPQSVVKILNMVCVVVDNMIFPLI